MLIFLLYGSLGMLAGLLSGLFGIGGGLIIVPILLFAFQAQSLSPEVLTHLALGTSLATIVFTSIGSVWTHHAYGAIRWDLFRGLSLGLAIGVVLGVKFVILIPGPLLQIVLAIFFALVGLHMLSGRQPSPRGNLSSRPALIGAGTSIGWASAMFGIGGGTLMVPYLSWARLRPQQAIATSAACGLPIALFGSAAYVIEGWINSELPEWSLGYIYLPAFIGIISTSIYFARLGAILSHLLPTLILKRCFAVLLLVVSARIVLKFIG